jgi:hypothetical protein
MYVCHDLRISNNSIWMNFVLFCLSKPGLPLRKRWSWDSLSFKLISRSFARKNAKMHAGNSNPNGPIWTISFFVRLHKGYLQQKDDNWIRWPSGSMSRSFAWKSTTTQITRTWMVWCGRFLFLYVHFHMSYLWGKYNYEIPWPSRAFSMPLAWKSTKLQATRRWGVRCDLIFW